ncbi:MAG: chemotaxis protein CheR [Deltaproteobacteria bacterium]|nr:chemotaxis protein CheR [Deltaproteobacteria bacterium]
MNGKTDSRAIPEALLPRLSDYLTARVGLHFAKRNWKELQQKMTAAMTDFGFDRVEEFIEWLLSSSPTQNQIEILAGHLTVGETYFFRERRAFEILEQSLLPGLIAARRKTEKRLRFWSAGCSTGEEPYSLAILLDKLIPDLQDWNVTILATDINTGALQKAEEGIYSDWSFRANPPSFKECYFEKADGNSHRLLTRFRKMVAFSYLNLSEDHYPALQSNTNAMDFIFCRNVLMYFATAQIEFTVGRFHRSLLDGGSLIVSPVETALLTHSPFVTVRFPDSTFYRKDVHKTKAVQKVEGPAEKKNIPAPSLPLETAKRRQPKKPSWPVRPAEFKKPEKAERSPCEEAAVLYQNGLYPEAEEKLRKLISNGGKNQESCVLFTKVLANQGELDEARVFCEEAVLADKCNVRLHYLLATILEEQKEGDGARASLKKALYLDRNFVLAHFALANLSLRAGKTADARKHFGNVAEILLAYKPDDIIPASDGITAGRLAEIIEAFRMREMS